MRTSEAFMSNNQSYEYPDFLDFLVVVESTVQYLS
jgi:hypothetical protein